MNLDELANKLNKINDEKEELNEDFKNMLDFVKSMNCDGRARLPGSNSSFKLPTADGAIILLTPNSLNAQIFALKFMRCGGIVCYFPCRGINATFFPLNSPTVIESVVLPYGVSIEISLLSFSKPES